MNITNDPEATWTTLSDKWPVGPLVTPFEIRDIIDSADMDPEFIPELDTALNKLSELYEQRIAELKKSITK